MKEKIMDNEYRKRLKEAKVKKNLLFQNKPHMGG